MAQILGVYNGNPTAGGTDGTLVSLDGSNTNPIAPSAIQYQTGAESQPIKLALRMIPNGTTNFYNEASVFVSPFRSTSVSTSIGTGITDLNAYLADPGFLNSYDILTKGLTQDILIGADTYTVSYATGHPVLTTATTTTYQVGTVVKEKDNVRWALAPDNAGVPGTWLAYGAVMEFTRNTVRNVNVIFWAKACYENGDYMGYNRLGYLEVTCANIMPQE